MTKITGIGGVFFKCNDPKAMKTWYAEKLGLPVTPYGATFDWKAADEAETPGSTTWSTFPADSNYFGPTEKPFMINYRVENIAAMVEQLKKDGITLIDEIADSEYGKFVHLLDPEGNAIELWEPPVE